MTRDYYGGGSYVEALPSGAFAVLFPGSHIASHIGRVELPPGDQPLYHRITEVGGFKIAGQAHASIRTLEWIGGQWHDRPAACGVSPVIYDHSGVLHISNCGPVGSQGFRYVVDDDRIVTGDQTYGPLFGLSEWSAYRDLAIGQGHGGGGCLVWDGAALRVLEPGDCRFIRVRGDGVNVAIAFVKPDGAVIVQTTLAELRALPMVGTPIPNPGTPPPTPQPEPVPMRIAPNRFTVIAQVIAENREAAKHEDTRGRLLDIACKRANMIDATTYGRQVWGRKSRNAAGTDLNTDVLCFLRPDDRIEHYDSISGIDGSATWDAYGPFSAGENGYWTPAQGASVPVPPAQPPQAPQPHPDVLAAILRRLDALEGPRRVALKSHHGRYVVAEQSGEVNATRAAAGPWELFTLEPGQ